MRSSILSQCIDLKIVVVRQNLGPPKLHHEQESSEFVEDDLFEILEDCSG